MRGWFGVGGTFKDHLALPSCHGPGHQISDQVTQNFFQFILNTVISKIFPNVNVPS